MQRQKNYLAFYPGVPIVFLKSFRCYFAPKRRNHI